MYLQMKMTGFVNLMERLIADKSLVDDSTLDGPRLASLMADRDGRKEKTSFKIQEEGWKYYQENLAPLPRRPGEPVQRKPGKLLEINPRGKRTLSSNPGMALGEVELIIALPSPRNRLTNLGLVDLAKLRLQQRAHPETSGTFAEYVNIRTSCHLVEVIGQDFYCDCKVS